MPPNCSRKVQKLRVKRRLKYMGGKSVLSPPKWGGSETISGVHPLGLRHRRGATVGRLSAGPAGCPPATAPAAPAPPAGDGELGEYTLVPVSGQFGVVQLVVSMLLRLSSLLALLALATPSAAQALVQRSGRDSRPRNTIALWNRGRSSSRRIAEKRSSSISRAIRPSRRARGAPRQWWMPRPNDR